ncbi:DUF4132 domain-containing protein [bacterium]|nr:DUF4132 domain-containing protein [bacterium]
MESESRMQQEVKEVAEFNCDRETEQILAASKGPHRQIVHGLFESMYFDAQNYNQRRQMLTDAIVELYRLPRKQFDEIIHDLFPHIGAYILASLDDMVDPLDQSSEIQPRPYRLGAHGLKYLTKTERLARSILKLQQMLPDLLPYRSQDIVWFAEHISGVTGLLGYYGYAWMPLASAIDEGDDTGRQVLEILAQSVRGEHPIAEPSHQAYAALMSCNCPEAWDVVEKMLLAAQRQEGLRQTILEQVDLSHPQAFRRMLRLLIEKNMVRFSSVARAVNVWLGLSWDSSATRPLLEAMETLLRCLDDPDALQESLKSENAQEVYFALSALAFDDMGLAIDAAEALIEHENVAHRFAAVVILANCGMIESARRLLKSFDDPDLRVAYIAITSCRVEELQQERTARVRAQFDRWPKAMDCEPILFPFLKLRIERENIAYGLVNVHETDLDTACKYLEAMSPFAAVDLIKKWSEQEQKPKGYRNVLLRFAVGGSDYWVEDVYQILSNLDSPLTEEEWLQLEVPLRRKSANRRKLIFNLLLQQSDEQVLRSAKRLTEGKNAHQRMAGLEILRRLSDEHRSIPECKRIAEEYKQRRTKRTEAEDKQLEAIISEEVPLDSEEAIETCFGLIDPRNLAKPTRPEKNPFDFVTPAAVACVKSLDALVHEHRDTPIKCRYAGEKLLGDRQCFFPYPDHDVPIEEQIDDFQMRDVWETWFLERGEELRDSDGLELLRASLALGIETSRDLPEDANDAIMARKALARELLGPMHNLSLRYDNGVIPCVLEWLLRISRPKKAAQFIIDAGLQVVARCEKAHFDVAELDASTSWGGRRSWGSYLPGNHYIYRMIGPYDEPYQQLDRPVQLRIWNALLWFDSVLRQAKREVYFPPLPIMLYEFCRGNAPEENLISQLIFCKQSRVRRGGGDEGHNLSAFTVRKYPDYAREHEAQIRPVVEKVLDRVLEIELGRGEKETPVSRLVYSLSYIEGVERLIGVLGVLGKTNFERSGDYWGDGKIQAKSFSRLVRAIHPTKEEAEAPKKIVAKLNAAKIPESRLIELAMFAPQWARHVGLALNWKAMEDAVWWFYAHTKDGRYELPHGLRERVGQEVAGRTPLSNADLQDGAVDVSWFAACYKALGKKRWDKLHKAAKYTCSNIGHSRARIFGDALRGELKVDDLIAHVVSKRNQDRLRAIGLVPLPRSKKAAQADVLRRYEFIQEFIRTGRKFGAQRRASEGRAAEIALDNLARTAGYADPLRLRWSMEIEAMSDLREGSKTIARGNASVTLRIDELGEAELLVEKNGKPQKSIPASIKKDPEIVDLCQRKGDLKKQVSRVRRSLEDAMIRADEFVGSELQLLSDHPLLAPMLTSVVFLNEDGRMGWLTAGGKTLCDAAGDEEKIGATDLLRIAHPCDFLASGEWSAWQRDCFVREITQPFKQVFRELYVPTKQEQEEDCTVSTRYAGHQVHPRQAIALLGSRGWVLAQEEGSRRTWFKERLNALLQFEEYFYTPADVEGLTLEGLRFYPRDSWWPKPLTEVPPRVFSETMRDLDLVVSVAHRSGVDPESSESSIEVRAAIVRETAAVLKLDNVRIVERHVIIRGELAEYNVHLGSAEAAVMPGGHLCIIPVHAAHRGRLFLPFVDDDPKCAELVAKVLLLARDKQIKDPSIRQQISGLTS